MRLICLLAPRGRSWRARLLLQGLALILFSRMMVLPMAIAAMVLFSLFVQMSSDTTFSVVPFINRKALGAVAGIVGAGGNAGAVAAGFLFRREDLTWPSALLILGILVAASSSLALLVRFSPAYEAEVRRDMETRIRVAVPSSELEHFQGRCSASVKVGTGL